MLPMWLSRWWFAREVMIRTVFFGPTDKLQRYLHILGQCRPSALAARFTLVWVCCFATHGQAPEQLGGVSGRPLKVRVEVNELKVGCIVQNAHTGPVRGLTAGDFRAVIDGVAAPVLEVGTDATVPIRIALLIDVSLSQRSMRSRYAEAAQGLRGQLQSGRDRVSIYTFGGAVRLWRDWEDVALLKQEDILQGSKAGQVLLGGSRFVPGGTRLFDALGIAANRFDSGVGRRAILVLTDGVDEGSKLLSKEVLKIAQEQGVSISALEFGSIDVASPSFLFRKLHDTLSLDSRETGGIFLHAKAGQESAQLSSIIAGLKEEYFLFLKSPTLGKGRHKLSIQVDRLQQEEVVRYPDQVAIP